MGCKPEYFYEPQKILRLQPQAINKNQYKTINDQMEKSVCKIKCNDGAYGTGFFCKISFVDEGKNINSLISNNHVLGENDIKIGKTIEFFLSDEQTIKKIEIEENRKTYTSEKYDISIIEIKPSDNLDNISFLKIEDNEINEIHTTENKLGVYLIHYPLGINICFSLGKILNISEDGYTIFHLCEAQKGSSGGPLINLNNHKVIGVHKGSHDKREYNLGSNIKIPIKEFLESIKNSFEVISKKIIYPQPVTREKLGIIMAQMANCVIKILKGDKKGTGFLAFIPVNDKKMPVLITCNHILDEKDISLNQIIKFTINNKIVKIIIDKNRKCYTNKIYDVTIIEIKGNENISFNSFLEINNENLVYTEKKEMSIYLLNNDSDGCIIFLEGVLKFNNKSSYNLIYNCSSQAGSSGCPILKLLSHKVIGIHLGNSQKEAIGVNINYPIKDFISIL